MTLLGNTDITHEEIMGLIQSGTSTIATNTAQLKFNKVAAVIEDTAITQANLIGFAITTTGTCVFVDADNNEMDLSNFQEGFYAGLPAKFKTGLTATVVALYFE